MPTRIAVPENKEDLPMLLARLPADHKWSSTIDKNVVVSSGLLKETTVTVKSNNQDMNLIPIKAHHEGRYTQKVILVSTIISTQLLFQQGI